MLRVATARPRTASPRRGAAERSNVWHRAAPAERSAAPRGRAVAFRRGGRAVLGGTRRCTAARCRGRARLCTAPAGPSTAMRRTAPPCAGFALRCSA